MDFLLSFTVSLFLFIFLFIVHLFSMSLCSLHFIVSVSILLNVSFPNFISFHCLFSCSFQSLSPSKSDSFFSLSYCFFYIHSQCVFFIPPYSSISDFSTYLCFSSSHHFFYSNLILFFIPLHFDVSLAFFLSVPFQFFPMTLFLSNSLSFYSILFSSFHSSVTCVFHSSLLSFFVNRMSPILFLSFLLNSIL